MMLKTLTSVLLLLTLSATGAAATSAGPGYIKTVYGTLSGAVIFTLVDSSGAPLTRVGVPSCAATQTSRWVIDTRTTAGGAAATLLFNMWAAHAQVAMVVGTATCTVQSDTETVNTFDSVN